LSIENITNFITKKHLTEFQTCENIKLSNQTEGMNHMTITHNEFKEIALTMKNNKPVKGLCKAYNEVLFQWRMAIIDLTKTFQRIALDTLDMNEFMDMTGYYDED
jgi:hypothetical protein